jgi:hypothetical protein
VKVEIVTRRNHGIIKYIFDYGAETKMENRGQSDFSEG